MLEKNSETLDFSRLKCYKRVKKRSVLKFKIQKNDKSYTYKVQFWREKYDDVAVIVPKKFLLHCQFTQNPPQR